MKLFEKWKWNNVRIGVSKPVEIDETYVYKRKYNRGRLLRWTSDHCWVFVMIERKTFRGRSNYGKTLTFLVEDRTKETL